MRRPPRWMPPIRMFVVLAILGAGAWTTAPRRLSAVTSAAAHATRSSAWRPSLVAFTGYAAVGVPIVLLLVGVSLWRRSGEQRRLLQVARKQAEEALRQSVSLLQATLESTADGILVVDSEGKLTSYNQRFVQLWGIPGDALREPSSQTLLDVAMDKLSEPDAFIARLTELGGRPAQGSWDSIVLRDGRELDCYSRPQLVEGQPVGRVWSFRDVSPQRRAEREQEKLFAEITRSNAELF